LGVTPTIVIVLELDLERETVLEMEMAMEIEREVERERQDLGIPNWEARAIRKYWQSVSSCTRSYSGRYRALDSGSGSFFGLGVARSQNRDTYAAMQRCMLHAASYMLHLTY